MKNISLLKFFEYIYKMKKIDRQGWKRFNIVNGETIAEHSFMTTFLAIIIADYFDLELDREKILKMALFHEVCEVITGDITPHDNISKLEKSQLEKKAVDELFSIVGFDNYIELWNEFEFGDSKEAKYIKQIDRLEMGLQAYLYEKEYNLNLQEFFNSVDKVLEDKVLKEFFSFVKMNRKK